MFCVFDNKKESFRHGGRSGIACKPQKSMCPKDFSGPNHVLLMWKRASRTWVDAWMPKESHYMHI